MPKNNKTQDRPDPSNIENARYKKEILPLCQKDTITFDCINKVPSRYHLEINQNKQ